MKRRAPKCHKCWSSCAAEQDNCTAMCKNCIYVFSNSILTFGYFLANFERPVLDCTEADFCKEILILARIKDLLKKRLRRRGHGWKNASETAKREYDWRNVAYQKILRELSLNIAQLSTTRVTRLELPWLHFPLGPTLAFFCFCVP